MPPNLNLPGLPPDKWIVNLNAETFRRVVDALALAPADLHKRRGSRRMPLRADVMLVRCDDELAGGPSLDVTVTDASVRGIGFLSATPLEPGSKLLMYLPSAAGQQPLSLRCDVIRCDAASTGKYQVGARFAA